MPGCGGDSARGVPGAGAEGWDKVGLRAEDGDGGRGEQRDVAVGRRTGRRRSRWLNHGGADSSGDMEMTVGAGTKSR